MANQDREVKITSFWKRTEPTADGNQLYGSRVTITTNGLSITEHYKYVDKMLDDECLWTEVGNGR